MMTALERSISSALFNAVEEDSGNPQMSLCYLWRGGQDEKKGKERGFRGQAAGNQIWTLPLPSSLASGKVLSPL